MTITLGYDPDRVRALSAMVRACLDALADCRSQDPAAAAAMRTVQLVQHNLAEQWIPLLEQLSRSEALLTWTTTTLPPELEAIVDLLVRRLLPNEVTAMIAAVGASTRLSAIADDAELCLELLSNPLALAVIAEWDLLDHDTVQRVVTSALHATAIEDPRHLLRIVAVVERIVAHANGHVDDGFQPGFARGLAASMPTLLPLLAPALGPEGNYPVIVIARDLGINRDLGTYDDLVDLFGAILRDETAQVLVGRALGDYTRETIDGLGTALVTWAPEARRALAGIEAVTDLVADATWSEQAELVAQAAADAAFRRRIGEFVGVGVDATLEALEVGKLARYAVGLAIDKATDVLADVRPRQLRSGDIPLVVYDVVMLSVMRSISDDPDVAVSLGLGADDAGTLTELEHRLRRIDVATDPGRRRRLTIDTLDWLTSSAPAVAALVADIRERPGFHEMTESRRPPQPD